MRFQVFADEEEEADPHEAKEDDTKDADLPGLGVGGGPED